MSLPTPIQPEESPRVRLRKSIAPYFAEFAPTVTQMEHLAAQIAANYDYLLRHCPFDFDRIQKGWVTRDLTYLLAPGNLSGLSADAYALLQRCGRGVRPFRVSLKSRFGGHPGHTYEELFQLLVSLELISEASPIQKLQYGWSEIDLRNLMTRRELSAKGKRGDLVQRLAQQVSEMELCSLTENTLLFLITEAGKCALDTLPSYMERFRVALNEAVKGMQEDIKRYRDALADMWLRSITAEGMMTKLAVIREGGLAELIAPYFAMFDPSAVQLQALADVLYKHCSFEEGPFSLDYSAVWECVRILVPASTPGLLGDAYHLLKMCHHRVSEFQNPLESPFWYPPNRSYQELFTLLLSHDLIVKAPLLQKLSSRKGTLGARGKLSRGGIPATSGEDTAREHWAPGCTAQDWHDLTADGVLFQTTEIGERAIEVLGTTYEQVREVIGSLLETWTSESAAYRRLRELAPPEIVQGDACETTLEICLDHDVIERVIEDIEVKRAGYLQICPIESKDDGRSVVARLCSLRDAYSFQICWDVSVWGFSRNKDWRDRLSMLGFDFLDDDMSLMDDDNENSDDESDDWEITQQFCRSEVTNAVLAVLNEVLAIGVGRLVTMIYAAGRAAPKNTTAAAQYPNQDSLAKWEGWT